MVDLTEAGCSILADRLGDKPETVIGNHMLRRGLCRASVLGAPEQPRAAMLQSIVDPTEPTGFGDDPIDIWWLLRDLDGWTCVNVPHDAGPRLAAVIANETGRSSRLLEDVYHILTEPAPKFPHPAVRLLTTDDLHLLNSAEADFGTPGWNWGITSTLLAEGFAAGGIVDDRLVGIAYTTAVSGRHADVGIATLATWRGPGMATACAALVCESVQATGRTPVWSTGENNLASLRVAGKLGFVEVHRRVYVIPEPPGDAPAPQALAEDAR